MTFVTMSVTQAMPPVLFEDNHLLIVNKPPGMLVQGDITGDKPLSDIAKQYIKKKYHKSGEVFMGVTHRIDRPVSGIVILARTSKSLERVNAAFRDKQVKKTYWAVVKNAPPEEEGHLVHYLHKKQETNTSRAFKHERSDAKRSELIYKVIGKSKEYYLLEITPVTGRHHQIRVQLAAAGCPIKGDLKYGFPRANADRSIHLHARRLEFPHPVSKETIVVEAAPPEEDILWKTFYTT